MSGRIIDLQRRLREVGRIRIGRKVQAASGAMRPAKLETFRLTSQDARVIDAAAEVYGGRAEPWDEAPDGRQWQVTTEATELTAVVPPSDMAFSQAFEQWSAGGCRVRCNGQWDSVGDVACHCDPTDRDCKVHTRLSIMLPELPGLGVWRLDTQGYNAAVELGGVVDLLVGSAMNGQLLPARLRLEQRSRKRLTPDGVETLRFVVPVLDVDVHPLALGGGGGQPASPLPPPSLPAARPVLTPVPDPDPASVLVPSVAEQVDAVAARRDNRRASPPPTGLQPRTAEQVAAKAAAPQVADMGPTVLWLRTTLNALGPAGRRAFLDRYGLPPQDLPTSAVPGAQAFVRSLVDERAGQQRDEAAADRPAGGRLLGEESATGQSPTPLPDHPGGGVGDAQNLERPPAGQRVDYPPVTTAAGPTATDVARKAAAVFRADYEAAPRRSKTKTVDRLRHALTYATTGKASLNACDPTELSRVWQRLEDIAAGRMSYVHDATEDLAGATFTMAGHEEDGGVTVLWAEVEQPEPEAEQP